MPLRERVPHVQYDQRSCPLEHSSGSRGPEPQFCLHIWMDIQTHLGAAHCSLRLTLHWGNRLLASEQLPPRWPADASIRFTQPFLGRRSLAARHFQVKQLSPPTHCHCRQSKQLCLRTAAPAQQWCGLVGWGTPANTSFPPTCALGLLKMRCYGLLSAVVQPFP